MRLLPKRKKHVHRTPWEQIVIEEARRHAVSDRMELEAVEAEILEHGAPVATAAAVPKLSLRRLLRIRRRRR